MKNTGGPAFPVKVKRKESSGLGQDITVEREMEGMTLRDYFAGQALVGLLSMSGGIPEYLMKEINLENSECKTTQELWSKISYDYAAAMLAEREKEKC